MDSKNKIVVWTTIVGSGFIASLGTSMTFFKDQTVLITSISTVVSAVVALIITIFQPKTPNAK